jgi:hypothetical protein
MCESPKWSLCWRRAAVNHVNRRYSVAMKGGNYGLTKDYNTPREYQHDDQRMGLKFDKHPKGNKINKIATACRSEKKKSVNPDSEKLERPTGPADFFFFEGTQKKRERSRRNCVLMVDS